MSKRGKQIETEICNLISSSKNPISTREIALQIKKAWHTVDRHCLKLQIAGKLTGFRIGNINAWVMSK